MLGSCLKAWPSGSSPSHRILLFRVLLVVPSKSLMTPPYSVSRASCHAGPGPCPVCTVAVPPGWTPSPLSSTQLLKGRVQNSVLVHGPFIWRHFWLSQLGAGAAGSECVEAVPWHPGRSAAEEQAQGVCASRTAALPSSPAPCAPWTAVRGPACPDSHGDTG